MSGWTGVVDALENVRWGERRPAGPGDGPLLNHDCIPAEIERNHDLFCDVVSILLVSMDEECRYRVCDVDNCD